MSGSRSGPACTTLALSIREARTPDDIAAAAAIYERAGRASFFWRPPDYFQASLFAAMARDETVFLAQFATSVVGFLSYYVPDRFVHSLYVDPDAQRLGVGRALVEHVRKLADGPLTLKLDAPNEAAIRFYEATGWKRLAGLDDCGVDDTDVTWLRYRLA